MVGTLAMLGYIIHIFLFGVKIGEDVLNSTRKNVICINLMSITVLYSLIKFQVWSLNEYVDDYKSNPYHPACLPTLPIRNLISYNERFMQHVSYKYIHNLSTY